MKADEIVDFKLKQINTLLGQAGLPHSIDEIAVMHIPAEGGESHVVFQMVQNGRVLDITEIWGPIEAFMFSGKKPVTGAIIMLEGQAGKMFDFVVLVIGKDGSEYYVLGNYLDGELEQLMTNPNWELAKAQYIVMAMELIAALESES